MLVAMAVTAALPLLLLASQLPRPLVLPVLSLIALTGAAIVALVAWRLNIDRNARHVTTWDIVGALTFIGFAAAMLSKPDQILIYFVTTATT